MIQVPLFGKQESILKSWNQAKIPNHVNENSELQTLEARQGNTTDRYTS